MLDTKTIDAVVGALYQILSGPAGERAWGQERALFFPGAQLVRTSVTEDGSPQAKVMDIDAYVEDTAIYFREHSFYEREVDRRTFSFGNIANVLSVYEARHELDDPEPFKRGINSIQLYWDGARWWIMHVLWDNERDDNQMPARVLTE